MLSREQVTGARKMWESAKTQVQIKAIEAETAAEFALCRDLLEQLDKAYAAIIWAAETEAQK